MVSAVSLFATAGASVKTDNLASLAFARTWESGLPTKAWTGSTMKGATSRLTVDGLLDMSSGLTVGQNASDAEPCANAELISAASSSLIIAPDYAADTIWSARSSRLSTAWPDSVTACRQQREARGVPNGSSPA